MTGDAAIDVAREGVSCPRSVSIYFQIHGVGVAVTECCEGLCMHAVMDEEAPQRLADHACCAGLSRNRSC